MDFEQVRAMPDGTTEYDWTSTQKSSSSGTQFKTSEYSNPKTFEQRNDAPNRDKTDPNASRKKDDEDDDIEKATWDDFIGNTTFHGCRFVFADSKNKMRK